MKYSDVRPYRDADNCDTRWSVSPLLARIASMLSRRGPLEEGGFCTLSLSHSSREQCAWRSLPLRTASDCALISVSFCIKAEPKIHANIVLAVSKSVHLCE